ncbi:MAG TPA: CoA transferase, partial [Dehalococcoidia bacterium]
AGKEWHQARVQRVAGALEGVHILDCSQIIAGPMASSLLSEMGADVVKVEPLEGEPWRLQAEFIPKESRPFINQNRGKRGVAIDLKRSEAKPVREALIRWADVIVINFRPGVAESLGLDYASARAIRPDIIYCENTAFGKEGPDAQRRGYDIVAQAMSGLITSNGVIENGVPRIVQFAPADALTGVLMAWSVTAALFHRQKTGEGQAINCSLLQTALFMQGGFKEIVALDEAVRQQKLESLAAARARGATMDELYAERRAAAPELMGAVYYRIYQTKDGYLAVGCLGPGPRARFRQALKIHDRRYDPDFDRTKESMIKIGAELVEECQNIMRTRTTGCLAVPLRLTRRGVWAGAFCRGAMGGPAGPGQPLHRGIRSHAAWTDARRCAGCFDERNANACAARVARAGGAHRRGASIRRVQCRRDCRATPFTRHSVTARDSIAAVNSPFSMGGPSG